MIKLAKLLNGQNIKKSLLYARKCGLRLSIEKIRQELFKNYLYHKWIIRNEPSSADLSLQRGCRFILRPKISIIVPVFNTPKPYLMDMVESVVNQTYDNWELCIADGFSEKGYIHEILEDYSRRDRRINVKYLKSNKGISSNSNEALLLSTGEYIALLDHDDKLPPFALHKVVEAINEYPDVDFIYTDEDKITKTGKFRFDPHFKPEWSPDTLRSHNYITHLTLIRKDLLEKIGYFREDCDGSQDYDLFLRATEKATKIIHIPSILYHWRSFHDSSAGNPNAKLYAYQSAKRALKSHLDRIGMEDGRVEDGSYQGTYRIEYKLDRYPKLSIIVAHAGKNSDLMRCLASIFQEYSYKQTETIVVVNDETDVLTVDFSSFDMLTKGHIQTLQSEEPQNLAAKYNLGASHASGEILLFLDSLIEAINYDCVENLLRHAVRGGVGVVGGKIFFPDDTIKHAGIYIGKDGTLNDFHRYYLKKSKGYMNRLGIVQNVSAVNGACLMIRKEIFEEISGFDRKLPFRIQRF